MLFKPSPATDGFSVVPGGIGHDMYSIGYDGKHLWVSQCDLLVANQKPSMRQYSSGIEGDGKTFVVGCCVDLQSRHFHFYHDGHPVGQVVHLPHLDMVTPAISVAGNVR